MTLKYRILDRFPHRLIIFYCILSLLHSVHFFNINLSAVADSACNERKYESGIVCVCNSSYCDEYTPVGRLPKGKVAIFTSSESGKRFSKSHAFFTREGVCVTKSFRKQLLYGGGPEDEDLISVEIDTTKQFQKILGFGGAFTDAAGININRLSSGARTKLLEAYYSEKGIEYSLGRVPIASCDFSTREYSYLDTPDDFELKTFALAQEDHELKIPFIRSAIEMTNGQFRLLASPWSAPGWMKTIGQMKGGGKLKGEIGGVYYETYAKYFVRFFEEYAKSGIDFWGLTIQNDPAFGADEYYPWQAMYYSHEMQRDFANKVLGPTLRQSIVTKDLKILAHDAERTILLEAAEEIYDTNPGENNYVDGLAIHWYAKAPHSTMTKAHEMQPDKFILASEACNGFMPEDPSVILGDWGRGEAYGHDIIQTLRNWVVGWLDWNICLDENGGPNWVGNFVDAPIIVNGTSDEFYKQPMYYFLGHFSKFLRPDSIRIETKVKGECLADTGEGFVEAVAVVTPENQHVLVIHNRDSVDHNIRISDNATSGKTVIFNMEPKSISTLKVRLLLKDPKMRRLAVKRAKFENEAQTDTSAQNNRSDNMISNTATLDNGTMVEAYKFLNYCQLAKTSLVSKRFCDLIRTHRHKLARLYVHNIEMHEIIDINHNSPSIQIFNEVLCPEAYNEWVVRNQYSKQVPEAQIAVMQSAQNDRKVYRLDVDADYYYKDSNPSLHTNKLFDARIELSHENWPVFQHFIRLLTDPFIFIRSMELPHQNDVSDLLASAINTDHKRLQCNVLVIELRGSIQKLCPSNLAMKWIKEHVLCEKIQINGCLKSNNDEELLDLFMTGANCASRIYIKWYDPCKVIGDFVKKFMELKGCDENKVAESIECHPNAIVNLDVLKRDYADFVVEGNINETFIISYLVFEFVNNDIEKKLRLNMRIDLHYSTEFTLKIASL
ncbi:glycosyl hydrolase family 30 TIM-barrel domain-containing protein [Ditylenchus destructor]|nr:glycosyl hydrolase family 30 TIM-barrel domain-containing protein [Ditylenchus destructor]